MKRTIWKKKYNNHRPLIGEFIDLESYPTIYHFQIIGRYSLAQLSERLSLLVFFGQLHQTIEKRIHFVQSEAANGQWFDGSFGVVKEFANRLGDIT